MHHLDWVCHFVTNISKDNFFKEHFDAYVAPFKNVYPNYLMWETLDNYLTGGKWMRIMINSIWIGMLKDNLNDLKPII